MSELLSDKHSCHILKFKWLSDRKGFVIVVFRFLRDKACSHFPLIWADRTFLLVDLILLFLVQDYGTGESDHSGQHARFVSRKHLKFSVVRYFACGEKV